MNFAELMKKRAQKKTNEKLITGKIDEKITIKGVQYYLIDAGLKYQGIVPVSEVEKADLKSELTFIVAGDKEHYILLSYEKAQKEIKLKSLKQFIENKEQVNAKIVAKVNNGYKVLLLDEMSALLQSQDDIEIGTEMKVYVTRIFANGNIIVSLTPSKFVKIKEGDIVSGTVGNFNDYFVFVQIDDSDLEGIIHFQDLSWEKINFPGEIINQGQRLQLKVLKIQNNCVYLGLKQTQDNPWNKVKDQFNDLNKIYSCEIKRINDYELIVALADEITGSIHISEISWGYKKRSTLTDDFQVGQHVNCKIIEIDQQRRKIKLSIKQLLPNPFFEFAEKHKEGEVIEGTILHDYTAYGSFLFVELVPGVDGMLHQSEIDWNPQEGIDKFMALNKNQKVKVQIIGIDTAKMRVSVSIKRLNPDFFEIASQKAQLGKVYDVEIKGISYEGMDVKILDFPECAAFIKKNEISNDRNERLKNFSVGDKLQAKLIAVHNLKRAFLLSVKARQSDENKEAIKDNKNTSATSSFGDFFKE